VTHLVAGTVVQEGQTVRITAKPITADGFDVWGPTHSTASWGPASPWTTT
jgi:TolB-like protein